MGHTDPSCKSRGTEGDRQTERRELCVDGDLDEDSAGGDSHRGWEAERERERTGIWRKRKRYRQTCTALKDIKEKPGRRAQNPDSQCVQTRDYLVAQSKF